MLAVRKNKQNVRACRHRNNNKSNKLESPFSLADDKYDLIKKTLKELIIAEASLTGVLVVANVLKKVDLSKVKEDYIFRAIRELKQDGILKVTPHLCYKIS